MQLPSGLQRIRPGTPALCGIVAFAVFMAGNAKAYYLTPIYPLLLAAGAMAIEGIAQRAGRRWLRS